MVKRGSAETESSQGVAVAEKAKLEPGLYWFGMLPATEAVNYPLPRQEKNAGTGEFYEEAMLDPWDLWTSKAFPDLSVPIFVGKLRQTNSLGAGGIAWNAYTNHMIRHGLDLIPNPYPGACKVLTAHEAEMAVKGCFRHFVEFTHGVGARNDFRCEIRLWDGAMADRKIEDRAQSNPFTMDLGQGQVKEFNAQTDMTVAEFVYLVRIEADYRKWPVSEYRRDPHSFHRQVVGDMSRKFFTEPPLSVAEMYPQA